MADLLIAALGVYLIGAGIVASRLGWHMAVKLDRYDRRFQKNDIWVAFAILVGLWPLLILKPRNILSPAHLFSSSHSRAARMRLRENPPRCGPILRFRQQHGMFQEAFGEFLFPAAAAEQVLLSRVRQTPHLQNDDEGAMLIWLRQRDGNSDKPADVPSLWRRFQYVADDLIRKGIGTVRCVKCDETFPTGDLIPKDREGVAGWIINKLMCRNGHYLLIAEQGHLLIRESKI